MINGVFYKGADLAVELETDIQLTGGTVSILVKLADGTMEEYTGEIVRFSTIAATIPAEDNTQAGEIFLQAKAVIAGKTSIGTTESAIIFDNFVVPGP